METTDKDQELKRLLKSMQPESPGKDFSARVMHRIFQEKAALEQVKKAPVLGRGFWIILALFAGLYLIVILLSGDAGAGESTFRFLNGGREAISSGYQQLASKLETLPASIAGILLASSLLLLLENYLQLRSGKSTG